MALSREKNLYELQGSLKEKTADKQGEGGTNIETHL